MFGGNIEKTNTGKGNARKKKKRELKGDVYYWTVQTHRVNIVTLNFENSF